VTGTCNLDTAVVINDSGADKDFRVEGDTDANLIFADASTDNVGVGTSSPQAKLVASNGGANGYELDPVNGFISAYNRSTDAWTKITTRASSYTFNLNNSNDALNLDTSGNLGLGVTPSAWAGATGLQVQNAALEGRSTLPSYGTFSVNGYTDSGTWKYISTDFASRYTQFQGQHLWFTAPSGTAGNAITFTQAMTLDASGNLGVGTTSPAIAWSGSAKAIEVLSTSTLAAGVRVRSANASAELFSSGSTTEWGLYSASDAPFVMYTNNAERARITAGGVVQINTTSASEDDFYLNVKGVNAAAFGDGYDQSNYGCVQIARPADQPDNKFHLAFVRSGQQVAGIGFLDNSSTFAIQNAGDNSGAGVTLTGSATSWGTTSDERKKDIKGNLESGVAKLADWRTVYFNYKTDSEDTPQRIGLIAQDVQATVPEAVSVEEDEQGTLQLRYSELIPVLVKAIQELKAELDATKAEVAALKGG
jgi:hypothetical protein